jgi:hypothetical protein
MGHVPTPTSHLSSVSQRRFIPLKHLLPLAEINLWKRVSLPPPVKEVDGGSCELQVTPLFFSYIGKNLRAKLCINKVDVTNDAQKYPKVLYYALN